MWWVDTANNDEKTFYVDNSKGFTVVVNREEFHTQVSLYPLAVADNPLLFIEVPFKGISLFEWGQNEQYCYIKFGNIQVAIKEEDEGVVIDVTEGDNLIGTAYEFYTAIDEANQQGEPK